MPDATSLAANALLQLDEIFLLRAHFRQGAPKQVYIGQQILA